jgi:hypothetical protein
MISKNIFKSLFVFVAGAALIASCDSEYNDIGADIIEGDIHHNGMTRYEAGIAAYDQSTGAVQTNNLPLNILGVYDNPAFGKTTAQFVTQLELGVENPTFASNISVDSVYLYVPYFSTFKSKDETTGISTYELDSIYGTADAEMTLKIYRNNYFLRSLDPGSGTSEPQRYYSNDGSAIHNANVGQPVLAQITNFKFSGGEIERKADVSGTVKTVERFAPGIFTLLDANYFKNAIVNAPAGSLVNNNAFKEYFRGLYFNVAQNGASGAMANIDFSKGKIVIIYRETTTGSAGSPVVTRKTLQLNMKGNSVNFFDNDYKPEFLAALAPESTNETLGDSRLFIKGGQGSMGIIKISDADLDFLETEGTIINEANLVFHVDAGKMGTAPNPLRVYLYDLKNKQPLYDYYTDATSSPLNPKYDKLVYGGILTKKTENGQPVFSYKIRLTNHINNIIRKDSANVPLGLVITENINIIANATLKTPFTVNMPNLIPPNVDVSTLPLTSVISPLGTVIYGNRSDENNNVPENKRLRLEIFYTKPN